MRSQKGVLAKVSWAVLTSFIFLFIEALTAEEVKAQTTPDYKPSNGPQATGARIISVNSPTAILNAIANANPGDEITVEDGIYTLTTDKIRVYRSGLATGPIFLRSRNFQKATLRLCTSSFEGFYFNNSSHWVFENLVIDGSACENTNDHAFHIVGGTRNIIIRNNLVTNFRSPVKVNGEGSPRLYPQNLWFLKNRWKMTKLMSQRAVPHNVLNIDGGSGHIVRENSFVDHLRPNGSSSSVYLKMGAKDFLVEQNLIVCQKRLIAPAGTAFSPRGIFGGDATTAPNPLCENNDCSNYRGVYRNNIIMNCGGVSNESGIQVRLERETKYIHNTIHSVRNNFFFNEINPTVSFFSNVMEKPFTFLGTARPVAYQNNLEQGTAGTSQIWLAPGTADFALKDGTALRRKATKRSDAPFDFCGHARSSVTDLGAIEYSHPNVGGCLLKIKNMYNGL